MGRAIHYRVEREFDHLEEALSVGIVKMVPSGLVTRGVIFTLDAEPGFRDMAFVTGPRDCCRQEEV